MPQEFYLRACYRSTQEKRLLLGSEHAADQASLADAHPAHRYLDLDRIAAFHEAGHLVVGLLFGMEPADVAVVGGQGFVEFRALPPSQKADLAMTLAGGFAGGLANRHEHRPTDAELTPWLDLVRQPVGGFCDRCCIFRSLMSEHGLDAPNDVILAGYRQAETHVLKILQRLDVRAAIRAVADALMKTGRLSGDGAAEIACRFITAGELLTEKELPHEAD